MQSLTSVYLIDGFRLNDTVAFWWVKLVNFVLLDINRGETASVEWNYFWHSFLESLSEVSRISESFCQTQQSSIPLARPECIYMHTWEHYVPVLCVWGARNKIQRILILCSKEVDFSPLSLTLCSLCTCSRSPHHLSFYQLAPHSVFTRLSSNPEL